jgi:hypothetical protein
VIYIFGVIKGDVGKRELSGNIVVWLFPQNKGKSEVSIMTTSVCENGIE